MPNNLTEWIKSASPIELFVVARRLADCNEVCPVKCTDNKEKCFKEMPYQCAMRFQKWALKETKKEK